LESYISVFYVIRVCLNFGVRYFRESYSLAVVTVTQPTCKRLQQQIEPLRHVHLHRRPL